LLVFVIVLLVTERLRADLTAMLTLAILIVLGLVGVEEALAGFANPATVTVACMFVLSAGLQSSGLVQAIGDQLIRRGPSNSYLMTLLLGAIIGPISAFINNTAAVAVFLPIAVRASEGRSIASSKVLMALSFFAMMGGTCTLVGTSTNILVSAVAASHGAPPFSMFEFSALGLILFGAGTAYMMTIGFRFTPERHVEGSLTREYRLNRYLSEVIVLPGSPLNGQSLVEARLGEKYDLEVLSVIRDAEMRGLAGEHMILREGDILLVKAPAQALVRLRDAAGIGVRPGRHPDDADLNSPSSALVEVVLTPNTSLEGRTLKGVNFRRRYGATTLAVRRHGADIREKIGRVRLRLGDELLLLADRQNLERLKQHDDFVILGELDLPVVDPKRVTVAVGIVAAVVAAAALLGTPIVLAALCGAVAMVLSGCLPLRKVYREVDWKVIFMLAGLIPLGTALETTGAARATVETAINWTGGFGPYLSLGLFFVATSVLTGFLSNTATAALMAPIAISTAATLGVDSRPYLVALTFAASAAFWTPIGYQTNLLVYGPGGYRFIDFVRVGGPLTVIYAAGATLLIPVFFPF
ncbi:MAG: SLC13 family permease, partial [Planctomycetota bacterium]|nr:SLC13 family permease [Planctomycetota bacterium]